MSVPVDGPWGVVRSPGGSPYDMEASRDSVQNAKSSGKWKPSDICHICYLHYLASSIFSLAFIIESINRNLHLIKGDVFLYFYNGVQKNYNRCFLHVVSYSTACINDEHCPGYRVACNFVNSIKFFTEIFIIEA